MITVNEAQALNAFAAESIEHADYCTAYKALSHTISELSWSVLSPTPIGGKVHDAVKVSEKNPSLFGSGVQIYSAEIVFSESDVVDVPKSEFFDQPFYFEWEESGVPKGRSDNYSMSSAQNYVCSLTCLFNMGLCYHLHWTRRGRSKDALLFKALHCYKQAFSLTNMADDLPVEAIPILMAICSNSCHCSAELGELQSRSYWNTHLIHLIQMQDEIEFDDDEDEMEIETEAFFEAAAFLNSFPRVAAAAA